MKSSPVCLWAGHRKNSFPCSRARWPTLPDCCFLIYAFALFLLVVVVVCGRATSYRIQSALLTRCSTDLSRRGTAVVLEGLTPSKTAGMSWRPSMPGTTRRLTSSTRSASRKAPLMWPPPSRSRVRIPKCSPSWFKSSVDLTDAVNQLGEHFGIRTLLLEGGGHINGAFLEADLVDEVSLLVVPGIDGRHDIPAVFDGV